MIQKGLLFDRSEEALGDMTASRDGLRSPILPLPYSRKCQYYFGVSTILVPALALVPALTMMPALALVASTYYDASTCFGCQHLQ